MTTEETIEKDPRTGDIVVVEREAPLPTADDVRGILGEANADYDHEPPTASDRHEIGAAVSFDPGGGKDPWVGVVVGYDASGLHYVTGPDSLIWRRSGGELVATEPRYDEPQPDRSCGALEQAALRRVEQLRSIADIGFEIGQIDERRGLLVDKLYVVAARAHDDGLPWTEVHAAFAEQAGGDKVEPTYAQLLDSASKHSKAPKRTRAPKPAEDQPQGSLLA